MSDVLFSLVNSVASRAVMLALNFIAVRFLIAEEYGVFSYLLGVVASIATLSGLGAGVTTTTLVAKYQDSDPDLAKKTIFASCILVSGMALILSILLVPFFDVPNSESLLVGWRLSLVVTLLVLSLSMSGVVEGALNGLGAYFQLSRNSVICLAVSLPIATILTLKMGFLGGVSSLVICRIIGIGLNLQTLWKRGFLDFRFDIKTLAHPVIANAFRNLSLPAMLGSLMVGPAIAAAMRIISLRPNGFSELAFFSWPYQIYMIAVFVPSALGGYFISKISRLSSADTGLITLAKYNFIFSFVVATLLFTLKPFLLGLAGDVYVSESGDVFDTMIFAVILYGLNATYASYWPTRGLGWIGFLVNFTWAGVLLSVTAMLVDDLGVRALAIGFVCAYSAQLVMQLAIYWYCRKRIW